MGKRIRTAQAATIAVCLGMLLPGLVRAEGIDTEHIFGFMIGADVGEAGEKEFQSETTGRFVKAAGRYGAIEQQVEIETVPVDNFRVELGTSLVAHDVAGVPEIADRRQLGWQGVSADFRFKFLDRQSAPFGFTLALDVNGGRIDDATGAAARNYAADVTLAFDREIAPNIIAALNLSYQPDWTRFVATGAAEQEAAIAAAFGVMAQVRPGILLGGEARYFRAYDGIGLQQLAGQAVFIGPVAYVQLSTRARLTATWSLQAWGRPAGSTAALDLVNFERHQARLTFGLNF